MDFFLHIIVLIGTFLPTILGYNLVFGKGKILHFGPMGVSVITGYCFIVTLKSTGSFSLAILSGLIAVTLISLLFAWLSLRLDQDAFGVMSIAVHLSALAVVLNWNSLTRGALGIPQIPRPEFLSSVADFAIAAIILSIVTVYIVRKIDKSSFGRQLQALAEHEWHAKSLGIDRNRVHVLAFIICGIGIFLSNLIYLPYLTLLHPNDYQFAGMVFYVMIVVAGMPGSVWGATLSTVLLLALREAVRFAPLSASVLGPVRLMLFGFILFVAVYYRRDTLFPKQRSI
ncbi:MAG: branched-chain amino acid ABC transporter permease [bacterium]|nr:branched-chain amino acid ABC transporter permease [bacterium]